MFWDTDGLARCEELCAPTDWARVSGRAARLAEVPRLRALRYIESGSDAGQLAVLRPTGASEDPVKER